MELFIENDKLVDVIEGKPSKKYRFTGNVKEKMLFVLQILSDAHTIHDIWGYPALNFEKLKGTGNCYSVRINNKYRLVMRIDWYDNNKNVGTIYVKDITNHYS